MLGARFDLSEVLNELSTHVAETPDESSLLDLEKEMAVVVQGLHSARTVTQFRCPVCDDAMRLRDERDLREFGSLDVKLHKLECDTCGMLTGRVFHPSVGYHARLVR